MKDRMEEGKDGEGLCGWIKDWNTAGGNQQVEELAQLHADSRGGGGVRVGGGR
jgi:hypothetical protein